MNDMLWASQNFLRDPRVVRQLLSKTNITSRDIVYDIGSGKGIIADALAEICHSVVCIEFDPRLMNTLKQNLVRHTNAVVYEADFLSLPLPQTPFKVFANIPFNMSADILHKLTRAPNPPTTAYLIVQREFAEKLIPNTKRYSSQLSILLGVEFEVRIVTTLQQGDFYPRPRVKTVLVELDQREKSLVPSENLQLFRDFVTYAYNAFKPTLAEALGRIFTVHEFQALCRKLGIPDQVKPSGLSVEQCVGLFNAASQQSQVLAELVGGFEEETTRRHHKRTKQHRTRP